MGTGAFEKRVPYDAPIRSFGPRRRYRGKMGALVGSRRAKQVVVMRGHTGSTRPTAAGYECGQKTPVGTAHRAGEFKVVMPPNYIRFTRSAAV